MDIFSLSAKIKLDDEGFTSGLKKAGEKFGSFASGVGRVAGVVTKAGAAAVGAGAVAIGGLVKQSVDAYGKYEQLVGGMETLFKDSSDEIIGYASEAYKTAGMSSNQYMETATQFSASLLKSLDGDTAKAAKYADKAIRQMSDNVNKMGTNVEMVQNAYRGFARGNFTMLDNLSLGYAGTKDGMQELLTKAEELSAAQGEYRDFSIDSYADIVDAIGLVQDEMGITGTTAKEAAGTVQGSAGSMKAAWDNLVTALGDKNADLGLKVEEFATSVSDMVGNIAPVVRTALESITKVVKEEGPNFVKALPGFILDIVPDVVEAAGSLVGALADGLTQSISDLASFIKNDDGNGAGGFAGVINGAINFVAESIPSMLNAGLDLFSALLNSDNLKSIIDNIGKKLPDLILGIVGDADEGTGIVGHFPDIVQGGLDLMSHLLDNVDDILAALGTGLGQLVVGIADVLADPETWLKVGGLLLKAGEEIVKGIVVGIHNFGQAIRDAIMWWVPGGGGKSPEDGEEEGNWLWTAAKGLIPGLGMMDEGLGNLADNDPAISNGLRAWHDLFAVDGGLKAAIDDMAEPFKTDPVLVNGGFQGEEVEKDGVTYKWNNYLGKYYPVKRVVNGATYVNKKAANQTPVWERADRFVGRKRTGGDEQDNLTTGEESAGITMNVYGVSPEEITDVVKRDLRKGVYTQ